MTMHDLIEKLKARPTSLDRDQQRKEWLDAIEKLFGDIESWLKPAVAAGVLAMSRSREEIQDDDLGPYLAPGLEIRDGRLTVRLVPVGGVVGVVTAGGKRHTGLRGRVDLICGPMKVPLGRSTSGTWKVLPLRGAARDLDEESFAEILREVLLDE